MIAVTAMSPSDADAFTPAPSVTLVPSMTLRAVT